MRQRLRRLTHLFGWLQTAWSIVGVTVALLLVIEMGLRGIFALRDWRNQTPIPDHRVISEGYGGSRWPELHYQELARLADRWEPYVYFRQKPLAGQTINIDRAGLRATWKPSEIANGQNDGRRPLKLLMLGGSSLWGFGARDDHTIPSMVARRLHEAGISTEIRNLSEIGYVSTQELVELVRELQAGYRPDLVIFYDGVNDTTSALLEARSTVTTNEINRVREFNLLQSPGRLVGALAGNLLKNSGCYRFAQTMRGKVLGEPETRLPEADKTELDGLAESIVRGYRANVEIVRALGGHYGFDPVFFWQPVIFTKPWLTPFEQGEAEKYGWTRPLFKAVLTRIEQTARLREDPGFHDLSRIFAAARELVFIDFCHTTEQANERIADEVVAKLQGPITDFYSSEKPMEHSTESRPR